MNYLYITFVLILYIIPTISNYYSPYYTPYENCIINLNYSEIDRFKSLTNQHFCINQPHTINNISFPETCTIGTGNIIFIHHSLDLYLTLYIYIYISLWVSNLGHAIVLKMIPIAHDFFDKCKLRSICERNSLTTAWDTYSHKKHSYINRFIQMINYYNYR
jgi:hypothetical protein